MKEIKSDLLIIGGGTSGLVAAIHAKDFGIENVTILEKRKVLGGCCPCFSMCMGIDTPLQKKMGINIDMKKVFNEHMKVQNWDCDGKLVSRWFHRCGETIEWLESMGVKFTEVVESGNFGDDSMKMMHTSFQTGKGVGSQIYACLTEKVEELKIPVYFETKAQELIVEDGRVIGVLAEKDGETTRFLADAVLIATGSISGAPDLIEKYCDYNDVKGASRVDSGMPHNTGDGFRMATAIGAKRTAFAVMHYGPHQHPYSNAICQMVRRPLVAAFNKHGERFVNESILVDGGGYQWMTGKALQHQPGQVQYTIVDHANLRDQIDNPKFECVIEYTLALLDFESDTYKDHGIHNTQSVSYENKQAWLQKLEGDLISEAKEGRVCIANTLDEAAAYIGCDPEVFKAEVEKYNKACETGDDSEFGKDARHLRPIKEAPFYVVKLWQGIDSVLGGIAVNHKLQVIDNNEEPIPGLYAAGVGVGGFVNRGYSYPGTESSFTMSSAFIATEEIAKQLGK